MALIQSIVIAADMHYIWPLIADPLRQLDWNPKIISLDRSRSGPVHVGERFIMLFQMNKRQRESAVEVIESLPPTRLRLRHASTWNNRPQIIDEAYDLSPASSGVRVVQTIDFSPSGIPRLIRALLWFLSRFGQNVQEPTLHRLKSLAEAASVATRP